MLVWLDLPLHLLLEQLLIKSAERRWSGVVTNSVNTRLEEYQDSGDLVWFWSRDRKMQTL